MRTLIMNTGETITGRDARALVRALRSLTFSPTETLEEFMAETAGRAKQQTGKPVRTDTPANFIEDLCAVGLASECTGDAA